MTKPKHYIEAAALRVLFAAFKILPLDVASYMGGFLARCIGPCMHPHKIAAKNLAAAMPELSEKEREAILKGMWDNLGRVIGEMPHLPGKELIRRIDVTGMKETPGRDKPAIFISGHLGNWELSYSMAHQLGIPITLVYRQANNILVDNIIAQLRATQSTAMLPKGPTGAVRLGRAIKDGQSLAMLMDQKMNEGIAVPFFGRDAMTAPAVAQLSLRYGLMIIPARVIRTKGAHFTGEVLPPLAYETTGDEEKDVRAIMVKINQLLESWIREHPEQWFWVHQRWPKT